MRWMSTIGESRRGVEKDGKWYRKEMICGELWSKKEKWYGVVRG